MKRRNRLPVAATVVCSCLLMSGGVYLGLFLFRHREHHIDNTLYLDMENTFYLDMESTCAWTQQVTQNIFYLGIDNTLYLECVLMRVDAAGLANASPPCMHMRMYVCM